MGKIKDKIIQETVKKRYVDAIPFHKYLGISVSNFDYEAAEMTLDWDNNLVGNTFQKSLHGGVTATLLDAVGGLVAVGSFLSREKDQSVDYIKKRIGRMGTVDLRIDYLRPGYGKQFIATARVIRAGRRVTVCRMEMHNDQNKIIAVGTGTYLWSD